MTTTKTTKPTSPTELLDQFSSCAAAGDVEGLVGLYELDAVFQPGPGAVFRGHDQIRQSLSEFIAISPQISYDGDHNIVEAGEIVLVASHWSMTATAPDGTTVRDGGISADVLRRQADGSWLIVIDQPRGEPTTQ